MCDTCKLRNGHVLYCTKEDLARYPALHERFTFRMDVEATWESISYVAEKAYDFKDVWTLFVDGGSMLALWRLHVAFGVIALAGGLVFGIWLLHITHEHKE